MERDHKRQAKSPLPPLEVLALALADAMEVHATALERYADALESSDPLDPLECDCAQAVQEQLDIATVALAQCAATITAHLKQREIKEGAE